MSSTRERLHVRCDQCSAWMTLWAESPWFTATGMGWTMPPLHVRTLCPRCEPEKVSAIRDTGTHGSVDYEGLETQKPPPIA